ncbi:MAG: hypothetical protein L0027_09785 [Candidatus Rokubacteria bacterium]|nr:hypothetical protein [Candidatus Rokubacteria bacterium]
MLPADLLPRKTYGLPIMAAAKRRYTRGGEGLRRTAAAFAPLCHSTLHGWLGGLGERALDHVRLRRDRPVPARASDPALPPFSAALVETERRTGAPVRAAWRRPVFVDPQRYRSRARRDQLEACMRLLAVATVAAAAGADRAADPVALLSLTLVRFFQAPMLSFPSRSICTAIQHGDGGGSGLRSPSPDRPRGGR